MEAEKLLPVEQRHREAARKLADYAGFRFAADHLDMAIEAAAEAFARFERDHLSDNGLREVLERLENACEAMAANRTSETYLLIHRDAGNDRLLELDDARAAARQALSQAPR